MKKYVICFCLLFAVCFSSYYVSYLFSAGNSKVKPEMSQAKNDLEDLVNVDNNIILVVNSQMRFIQETYNKTTKEKISETIVVPAELLGLTREELVNLLDQKTEFPTQEDKDEGLEAYQLISFSEYAMTIRKTIEPESKYKYYLVAENDYLLVYYEDMETTCLYTHIALEEFPVEEQSKLMSGMGFETMLEVYNYLESYTS